ncbi:MAG TPA: acylphosphatase [Chitinophagaceae bacterium]|nr:acylphosphatase [Chitinophagaceae bacterium]
MEVTYRLLVTGKVQGVFYRQSTREKARELGLTGTVRNLPDGRVEIIATGTQTQLEQLRTWCRQGPPRALVTDIEASPLPLQSFDSFTIIRY